MTAEFQVIYVLITHWGHKGTSAVVQQRKQQSFYCRLTRTTLVSRYQKKHSPTHHPDHHPIFISFFHLLRSIASSLFKLRAWQSFCTTSPRPAVMQCSTFVVSKLCSCKLQDAQYRAHIPLPTYLTKWKFVWWLFATVLADKVMLSYILSR